MLNEIMQAIADHIADRHQDGISHTPEGIAAAVLTVAIPASPVTYPNVTPVKG